MADKSIRVRVLGTSIRDRQPMGATLDATTDAAPTSFNVSLTPHDGSAEITIVYSDLKGIDVGKDYDLTIVAVA
jgi:hypothetical protein